ncbi:MAG: helix-turn-helix transcriptional regulator [Clostridia bacterium]|nr:helix-turn-helix transcriptional regulator [Clostridia bacterium]
MKLCETICRLRTEKGMSQGELAEYLDVSRQSVSKWETGASVPELDKLMRLRALFGVTLDELVGEEAVTETACEREPVVKELIPGRKIVGAVLFAIALLSLYYLDAFEVMLFTMLGLACFLVSEHTVLVCGWILFCYFDALYAVHQRTVYSRSLWVFLLLALCLIVWTVYAYRRSSPTLRLRRMSAWMLCLSLLILVVVPLLGEGLDALADGMCLAIRERNGGTVSYPSADHTRYYAWQRVGLWSDALVLDLRAMGMAVLCVLFFRSSRALWTRACPRLPVLSDRVRTYLGAGLIAAALLTVTVLCVFSAQERRDIPWVLLQSLVLTLPLSLCGVVLVCVRRHTLLVASWSFLLSVPVLRPWGIPYKDPTASILIVLFVLLAVLRLILWTRRERHVADAEG